MYAVEVSHLTKEYRLGAMQSLRQTAANAGARLLGRTVAEKQLFKALDDVSFTVQPGEVVGIIGHNGAGKSTLLKLLSRISTPTSGSVKVNGRIAPLIEVGAGFVGDFTGRENVYLNGAILGMPKKEIDKKFDEIVDFAEMADFIDTPVKRYSSGMQVKLAFAVATSIESEILIVDEVLAVGDLAFQRKCFDRMEELIKLQGRTVLLVSHNIRQVERLCPRAILLKQGRVLADSDSRAVCNLFYEQSDARLKELATSGAMCAPDAMTTNDVEVVRVCLVDSTGKEIDTVCHNDDVTVQVTFQAKRAVANPIFGIGVHTVDFIFLATAISEEQFTGIVLEPGRHVVRLRLRRFQFLPGVYAIRLGINGGEITSALFYKEGICNFQVVTKVAQRTQAMQEGFVELSGDWSMQSGGPASMTVRTTNDLQRYQSG